MSGRSGAALHAAVTLLAMFPGLAGLTLDASRPLEMAVLRHSLEMSQVVGYLLSRCPREAGCPRVALRSLNTGWATGTRSTLLARFSLLSLWS